MLFQLLAVGLPSDMRLTNRSAPGDTTL